MHTRADFLAAGAVAAGAFAAMAPALGADAASPTPSPAPAAAIPQLKFDLAAFDAATSKDVKHRHMFASTKLQGGDVLDAVTSTQDAYALVGEPAASMLMAVVLYHGPSIGMAFNDQIWRELLVPAIGKVPERMRPDLADYKDAKGNPFLKSSKPDEASVERLVSTGTLFFVCNNAVQGFSRLFARMTNTTPLAVYKRLAGGLVPGASLVPAGVWAVHALQERHFTYLQTTL